MKRAVSILVIMCLVLSGCATTQRLSLDRRGSDRVLLVGEMETDAYGRPVPGKRLRKRPTKIGKHYTVVVMQDGLPLRSFDIGVIEPPKADFAEPVGILGASTFAGATLGAWVALLIIAGDDDETMSDDNIQSSGDLAASSVMVGAALGLVFGFIFSVPSMAEQIHLFMLRSDETLVGYAEYEYDALRRLCLIKRYYARGEYDRVESTNYLYEGTGDVPVSTETSSDYVRRDGASGI